MKTTKHQKGESILEVLLAVAIFSIIVPSILYIIGTTADRQAKRNWYYESLVMMEDIKDVIRQKKIDEWSMFSENGMYEVKKTGSNYSFVPISSPPSITSSSDLVSYVIATDAYRNSESKIVESNAPSAYVDPATRKITIIIDWYGAVAKTESSFYITRTDNVKSKELNTKQEYESGALLDGVQSVSAEGALIKDSVVLAGDAPGPLAGVMSYWSMNGENESRKAELDGAEGGVDNLSFEGVPNFVDSRFGKALETKSLGVRLYASSSARLELTGQATFVVWLKSQGLPLNPETIIDKKDSGSGYLIKALTSGQIEASIAGVSGGATTKTEKNTSDNLWHMIAFVYDGEKLIPYFDGVQNGQIVTKSGALNSSNSTLTIGNDNEDAKTPYSGQIDDVQFYANALDGESIDDLLYSTYKSTTFDISDADTGSSSLAHTFSAIFNKPTGAKVDLQLSIAQKVAGSCIEPINFVGPGGSKTSYFTIQTDGLNAASFPFPIGKYDQAGYENPGSCVSFRIRMSYDKAEVDKSKLPGFSNVKIIYSL
ncbi:MAG: LamG domain-containing protein [Patescibacteria group bacterium]